MSHSASFQPTTVGIAAGAKTAKFSAAIKEEWEKRTKRSQYPASSERTKESHVDDILLVLALLGEALVPLGVFDDANYNSSLVEVQASISSGGDSSIINMFDKLEDELKYLCTAALTVCAIFSPMHLYRGFGACVFGDWNWGCPDFDYLEKKAKRDTSMFAQVPNPQPNRKVLLTFDRIIQVLQVKSMSFLKDKPSISGFSDWQPRMKPRPKKEVSDEISLCKDWAKQLEKRGHPCPPGMTISSWGIPWAGWTSDFNCRFTKDWEGMMFNQMDPGRLLHAFLCRGSLTLHDGQMLSLPPGTSAESLACWLAGRPGMTHKIVRWECFQTSEFEKKVGKKMAVRLGRHPLPNNFVIRSPNGPLTSPVSGRRSVPSVSAKSPPPYSTSFDEERSLSTTSTRQSVAEVGGPDPRELDSRERSLDSSALVPTGESLQKSMTTFRRKPAPVLGTRHSSAPLLSGHTTPVLAKNDEPSTGPEKTTSLPSRPPKVPINHTAELSADCEISGTADATKLLRKPDAHYLELLNAVARGDISQQKLQDILESGDPMTYITTEPQELSNDPAPPKLMGVPIPLGEVQVAGQSTEAKCSGHTKTWS